MIRKFLIGLIPGKPSPNYLPTVQTIQGNQTWYVSGYGSQHKHAELEQLTVELVDKSNGDTLIVTIKVIK